MNDVDVDLQWSAVDRHLPSASTSFIVHGPCEIYIWGPGTSILRFHSIRRRTLRTGRTQENLSSIGERQISSVRAVRAIFCLVAIHQDFGPDGQIFLREASPEERVGRTAFDHPARRGSVWIFHVNVNPGMWVDQFDFGHNTAQFDRLLGVKFSRECVMGPYRRNGQK